MRPLGRTASLVSGGSARLARIDKELELAYGTPESELGNQSEPLDECVYIILSFQTDVARLKASWESLRKRFPSWHEVRRARIGLDSRIEVEPSTGRRQRSASRGGT